MTAVRREISRKMTEAIARSLLDNDLYKFAMQGAVWRCYPDTMATYEFFNRDPKRHFNEGFLRDLRREISALEGLALTGEELCWMGELNLFDADYLDWLKRFAFSTEEVQTDLDTDGNLSVRVHGPWVRTILWEVPLMALISGIYFETIEKDWDHDLSSCAERAREKGIRLSRAGCRFSDFGTRRRRSPAVQAAVLCAFLELPRHLGEGFQSGFLGTSNVHYSRLLNTKPIGTVAHEWTMAHAGLFGIEEANRRALRHWIEIYGGGNNIALTDTFTTRLFLESFDAELARAYDGVRHDSGDPFVFVERILEHYEKNQIDPRTKTLVFSDGLNVDRAIAIERHIGGRAAAAYGIGTNFTNDFKGSPSLNFVIKMTEIEGEPVAKISDDRGKLTGHGQTLAQVEATVEAILRGL